MVRPVPMITIDFGDGRVVTRTLRGNIAMYVCAPDGQVLDVLPGIYEPKTFLDQLGQLRLLFEYFKQYRFQSSALQEYHLRHAKALAQGRIPGRLLLRKEAPRILDLSKRFIETSTTQLIKSMVTIEKEQPAGIAARWLAIRQQVRKNPLLAVLSNDVPLHSKADLSNWDALIEDTRINETKRRFQIHAKFMQLSAFQPEDIKSWIYREVLKCDIDDPYLGLGANLFATNPFNQEDAVHA